MRGPYCNCEDLASAELAALQVSSRIILLMTPILHFVSSISSARLIKDDVSNFRGRDGQRPHPVI